LEAVAVKANELLLWLSARREGSWRQFRAATEELHSADNDFDANGAARTGDDEFRLHQRLRLDLECLAHVEFFASGCEEGWRVTPPTLAVHPMPIGFRAILCGARSPALRERVIRAGQTLGCETFDSLDVPDVIRFIANDISALSEVASQAGICFQPNAALAILSHIPPCDPPSRRRPQSEFPHGADWRIREFDSVTLGWRTTDRQRAQTMRTGLFEFQLYDRWNYFLRWAGETFKLPRAVALYVLLSHHRGLLRYDTQTHTLSLPGSCRPPRLLERALVLCSGFPPSFDPATVRLTYTDVPPEIAQFAGELLRQPLA
jgi:hypothetical protein